MKSKHKFTTVSQNMQNCHLFQESISLKLQNRKQYYFYYCTLKLSIFKMRNVRSVCFASWATVAWHWDINLKCAAVVLSHSSHRQSELLCLSQQSKASPAPVKPHNPNWFRQKKKTYLKKDENNTFQKCANIVENWVAFSDFRKYHQSSMKVPSAIAPKAMQLYITFRSIL